jgi:hypothetical protein
MTPEQKLKHAMLLWAASNDDDVVLPDAVTAENVDALYDELLVEQDLHWDAKSEMRSGEVETGIPCDYSRHYESKAVAAKMPDGSWVGWTYWYGGGKHGEPEAIDWIEEAYDLTCTEEEKLVVVRTFTRTPTVAA